MSLADFNRNELWEHDSDQKGELDSRPPSRYEYDQGRGISPAASYQDLRHSSYAMPQVPYQGSPFGSGNFAPSDTRSMYRASQARSVYAGSLDGQPHLDPRASTYSLQAGFQPYDPRVSSYSFAIPAQYPRISTDRPPSAYSPDPPHLQAETQPPTNFLPEVNIDQSQVNIGEAGITDAQLEVSIRRICEGADLDNLTKKGVRKQLEEEYGVALGGRKEVINGIIERVLAGMLSSIPGTVVADYSRVVWAGRSPRASSDFTMHPVEIFTACPKHRSRPNRLRWKTAY